MKKNIALIALSAITILSLTFGFVQRQKAIHHEDIAAGLRQLAEQLRHEAEQQRIMAEMQRKIAEENLAALEETIREAQYNSHIATELKKAVK